MYDYRKLVFDSLDKAYDNGYDLSSWPAQEVVDDLMRNDDDILIMTVGECVEYVHEWQDEMVKFKREY